MMKCRCLCGVCLVAGAVYCGEPSTAHADIFRLIGAPLGGIIAGAATPTIRNVEGAADRVVDGIDEKITNQLGHVDKIVSGALASADTIADTRIRQVDQVANARMTQADGIMAARIAQVDVSTKARISQALGGLQILERKVFEDTGVLADNLDEKVKSRLADVDAILSSRVEQVDGVVRNAITQIDAVAAERIQQADDAVQRNIGTADVIATKQGLNLQLILLRVSAIAGMIVFLAGALRYTFEKLPDEPSGDEAAGKKIWGVGPWGQLVLTKSAKWILTHLAVGAVGIGLFLLFANWVSIGPKHQQELLVATHERGLQDSMKALDFTKVRYHAAQLTVLDPDHENAHRAVVLRAELVRTVFYRPGLLSTSAGIRQLSMQVDEAMRADAAAKGVAADTTNASPAADILAARCFVQWQLARTRHEELSAATDCAAALEAGSEETQFGMRPLAARYVRLFLARPIAWTSAQSRFTREQLAGLVVTEPASSNLLDDAARYDELVLQLDHDATVAYLAMLKAHADVRNASATVAKDKTAPGSPAHAALTTAKAARLGYANDVIAAWSKFDELLRTDGSLAGSNVVLALFELNDAPLAEALWFAAHQDEETRVAPRIVDEPSPTERARMTPIRVEWARRYLKTLGSTSKQLAGYEGASRFIEMEKATERFEQSYVDYLVAAATGAADIDVKRIEAAVYASDLGLYDGAHRSVGETLLGEGGATVTAAQRADIEQRNDLARLRLL